MATYTDVMVDLETLGTVPGSTILSIGLCPFTEDKVGDVGDRLHLLINRSDSEALGFTEDVSTLAWWGQQTWEAQETLREATFGNGLPVIKALNAARDYLDEIGNGRDPKGWPRVRLWGCGAAFDNVLLAAAYRRVNLPVPWPFWNDRCFRTLKAIDLVGEPSRHGTQHHALDDAVHQATWAVSILQCIDLLRNLSVP